MKRQILKYIALAVIGVALSLAAHQYATESRGYEAIGGEFVFVLLPVLWWFLEQIIRDWLKEWRKLSRHDEP
jgi:hypothetical protein